ncbi:hypothetical protein VTJ83DRAFT_4059 [Remersonia thermophila]|uniref:F-box domain-containing protein n=1 Tax=Remersonia thermophila TaxID=72144 RepID=A0ABR4DFS3_9PEZI
MFPLYDLPNELLEAIVAAICRDRNPDLDRSTCLDRNSCDCPPAPPLGQNAPPCHRRLKATLTALCLTSRRLSAVATRHLYHHLEQPYLWMKLVPTLATRPDLARHVRSLRWVNAGARFINGSDYGFSGDNAILVELFEKRRAQYLAACPSYGETRDQAAREVTFEQLFFRDSDLVLSLIASMLPNLEALAIHPAGSQDLRFNKPGSLPRLRHLHLGACFWMTDAERVFAAAGHNLETVVLEMEYYYESSSGRERLQIYAPEMETGPQLQGEEGAEEGAQELEDQPAPRHVEGFGVDFAVPSVTHLTVRDSELHPDLMVDFFVAFPHLTHLHFRLGGPSGLSWTDSWEEHVQEYEQEKPALSEIVSLFRSRKPKGFPRLRSFVLEITGNPTDWDWKRWWDVKEARKLRREMEERGVNFEVWAPMPEN